METTLDDVRRPLRWRKIFLGLALASFVACVLPWGLFMVLRDLISPSIARAISGAGLAFLAGHAVLALLSAYLLDLAVRRDEESWARARGGQVLLTGTNALNLLLVWSSPWYWDEEGLTTAGRARYSWADLQRVTTRRRRADTVLNALWNYQLVHTTLTFSSGASRAALHTSNFSRFTGLGKRRQAFSDAVAARVANAVPHTQESRGRRWFATESTWQRAA